MINLKQLSQRPWLQIHKWFAISIATLAVLGFLDATYLTVEHLIGGTIPCSVFTGCETVLNSKYSAIGIMPTAFLGVVYYGTVFLLALLSATRRDRKFLLLASILTIAGLLASVVFVFLMLVVIKAICLYCMFSALDSSILFIIGTVVIFKEKKSVAE